MLNLSGVCFYASFPSQNMLTVLRACRVVYTYCGKIMLVRILT